MLLITNWIPFFFLPTKMHLEARRPFFRRIYFQKEGKMPDRPHLMGKSYWEKKLGKRLGLPLFFFRYSTNYLLYITFRHQILDLTFDSICFCNFYWNCIYWKLIRKDSSSQFEDWDIFQHFHRKCVAVNFKINQRVCV